MRFPHAIEILSPTGTDAYGNPGASFPAPGTGLEASAFIVQRSAASDSGQVVTKVALLPPDTAIEATDRIVYDGKQFDIVGDILTASSPSRTVLKTATLREVAGA